MLPKPLTESRLLSEQDDLEEGEFLLQIEDPNLTEEWDSLTVESDEGLILDFKVLDTEFLGDDLWIIKAQILPGTN